MDTTRTGKSPVYAQSESEEDEEQQHEGIPVAEDVGLPGAQEEEVDDEELEAAYDGRPDLKRRRRDPDTGEVIQDPPAARPATILQAAATAAPPASRARLDPPQDSGSAPHQLTTAAEDQATVQANLQLLNEQISAALFRITTHMANSDKFLKASSMLRQLLDGGQLQRCHRSGVIAAAKAAFVDLSKPTSSSLRREYMRLAVALERRADVMGRAYGEHVSVYVLLGRTQNELFTDDSFAFNKVLVQLKAHVTALPEAVPADDLVHDALLGAGSRQKGRGGSRWGSEADELDPQQAIAQAKVAAAVAAAAAAAAAAATAAAAAKAAAAAATAAAAQERKAAAAAAADPFNLDSLFEAPTRRVAAAAATAAQQPCKWGSSTDGGGGSGAGPDPVHADGSSPSHQQGHPQASNLWHGDQVLCMWRQALLSCVDSARAQHAKHAWAKVSVELMIELCQEHRHRFCAAQQALIDSLMVFVRAQRVVRKQGPSAKEAQRDKSSSYDEDRAVWSKAKMSARGKVGGGGDTKSVGWLG
ncbi:MAG: hypothetical protein WDW38_011088 [Sanguina aurantia]